VPGSDPYGARCGSPLTETASARLIAFIGQLRATTKTIGRSAELYIVDEYE